MVTRSRPLIAGINRVGLAGERSFRFLRRYAKLFVETRHCNYFFLDHAMLLLLLEQLSTQHAEVV